MFWLRNKKNNFQLRTLILGPGVDQDQMASDEKVTEYDQEIPQSHTADQPMAL